jgi:hypothetical protein
MRFAEIMANCRNNGKIAPARKQTQSERPSARQFLNLGIKEEDGGQMHKVGGHSAGGDIAELQDHPEVKRFIPCLHIHL